MLLHLLQSLPYLLLEYRQVLSCHRFHQLRENMRLFLGQSFNRCFEVEYFIDGIQSWGVVIPILLFPEVFLILIEIVVLDIAFIFRFLTLMILSFLLSILSSLLSILFNQNHQSFKHLRKFLHYFLGFLRQQQNGVDSQDNSCSLVLHLILAMITHQLFQVNTQHVIAVS